MLPSRVVRRPSPNYTTHLTSHNTVDPPTSLPPVPLCRPPPRLVLSQVVQHKAKVQPAFAGEGMSLGGGSGGGAAAPLSGEEAAAEARARRLARFGGMVSTGDGAKPDPEVAK